MTNNLLTSQEAAERLGVSIPTLYDWMTKSDAGEFRIRGELVTIHYLQGGQKGQGRIKVPESEIDRLLSLMTVRPRLTPKRNAPRPKSRSLQHITATPGRPAD